MCRLRNGRSMTKPQQLELANSRKREKAAERSDDSDSESNDEESETTDPKIVALLMRCPRNLDNITVSGVDLGISNVAGTIIRTWQNLSDEIHISNVIHQDYHHAAGFKNVNAGYVNWSEDLIKIMKPIGKKAELTPNETSGDKFEIR
ncbi:hypothetical protein Bhyg_13374 [Pseudolycoriella hygida]|uniref:Uncharacterized protein n=1 Tax=Pseudolycoriella hygida TaxID=35572 RepID=A0A9Q0RUM3_9DIPT|nr:hypothetical protein Bhyg_13374 [Pseudolycoriella hygida]